MRQPQKTGQPGAPSRKLQVPLLCAFREAAEARDSRKSDVRHDEGGARIVSDNAATRRRGANEAVLKRNLNIDLEHLANTVNLASVIDLDDHPRVRHSVLNYGIDDLTHLTTGSSELDDLGTALRQALVAHEPRLVSETLVIEQKDSPEESGQRIRFFARDEMKCRPVDIPLEFVAEIDVGSGKIDLQGISGATRKPRAPRANPDTTPETDTSQDQIAGQRTGQTTGQTTGQG